MKKNESPNTAEILKLISSANGMAQDSKRLAEESQQAWSNGNKSLASEKSNQSKSLKTQIEALNEQIKTTISKEISGKEIQTTFEELSLIADSQAEKMKLYFSLSKECFDKNNKSLAKDLSDLGKSCKIQLEEYNRLLKEERKLEKNIIKTEKGQEYKEIVKNMQSISQIDSGLDYEEMRKKAFEQGDKMGKAFENAQILYKNGDKAKAKQQSEEGQKYRDLMHEQNKQAAIKAVLCKNKEKANNEIDLHGLLVEEAIKILAEKIKIIQKSENKCLVVIVGKGIHSKGEPKLKSAVIEYAKNNKILFSENVPNEGCILFDLNDNSSKFECIIF